MKRILSIVLICALLVFSLVPDAAATETESAALIELLEFCLPNGTESKKVYRKSMATSVNASFNLFQAGTMHYIDIMFSVPTGASVDSVYLSLGSGGDVHTGLTVLNIHGDIYRAYGQINITNRAFFVFITGNATWVEFNSVRISLTPMSGYDEQAQCFISAMGYNATINYVPTDIINYRNFIGDSEPTSNSLSLFITCDNWRKYDYLDYHFSCDISTLSSIAVTLGDKIIPCKVSTFETGGTISNHYDVTVQIDLTQVDRSTSEGLIMVVRGSVNSGSDNFISMDGCRGYVVNYSPNPIFLWFNRIYLELKNGFKSLGNSLDSIIEALRLPSASVDEFKEESSNVVSGLDNISSSMDSVDRPSMDSINADFSGDISDAAVLMTGLFSEVTGIPWLSTIILASCTLGLISYILYGKD